MLTMVNGKNTVSQIASAAASARCGPAEIIARLLSSGLIEKRDISLSKSLFPEVERIVLTSLGASARALLYNSYTRAAIHNQNSATIEQLAAALDLFGTSRRQRPSAPGAPARRCPEVRLLVEQVS